ncbi:phenylalanine--tRNA ligase subunit alpha [Borrelia anserina]|uniref:phenylalanine--tRNA ligase n=2 Tax=Borrelia anserina TaxID=143 RepID=W5SPE7_BORAN|nr:phenylalanine--tRNA ligase subunit alpha [Borrelia anserina]AHH08493.1 Phenylalanyl-tRNA synthetase alpha chain [Borrelia anserina BA2]APR64963.1 phenylalanine--tRNA ligase subunit alpha [Borrelia anserina Es]UPA06886.1 phenylalanine--tRNA ligase subunit alpha [Borrelia anserina]
MENKFEILKALHPLEIKAILNYKEGDEIFALRLAADLFYNEGQSNKTIEWLVSKGILRETFRKINVFYRLTQKGIDALDNGLIEERVINLVSRKTVLIANLSSELAIDARDAGKAFGNLSKEGVLSLGLSKEIVVKDLKRASCKIVKELLIKAKESDLSEDNLSNDELLVISNYSKKKGASDALFKVVEKLDLKFRFSEFGLEIRSELRKNNLTGDEIVKLTPEILKDKSYKDRNFRAYNIHVSSRKTFIGRANPYSEYIAKVKDKLVSLGFEEFDGPLVESEFFNNDALFMPQFHPARDLKDAYYIKEPSSLKSLPEPYFSNVKAVHENGYTTSSRGWRYDFSESLSKRLVLRTQGTVLSVKQLIDVKNPGKYFGIVRCFRYDQVDATHGADFYQTEGIVIGDVNIKTLLGLLEIFAKELAGATEVKYVPAYFPFTEPSIEVHVKHPVLGWFELGGSGIFRPEVTKPFGIDVPVIAWGIGIDRMALMHLGLSDLRELFTHDIGDVVLRRGKVNA